MFIGYQQVVADASVKTASAFTSAAAARATLVMLQAETADIRYTMDGTTPTETLGMLLKAGLAPEQFTIDDFRNVKFVRTATAGKLNAHFVAGRDII